MKDAMRSKDELRLSVLRMLMSAVGNKEIEKRTKGGGELNDEEMLAAINSEVKKRRDAVSEYEKGGRPELAEKETAEAVILQAYLPSEMGDEEIEKIVRNIIGQLDDGTVKPFDKGQGNDFGRVMAEAMKQMKGQAFGDRVSAAVKKYLK